MKWEDGWPLCPVCGNTAMFFYSDVENQDRIYGCDKCIEKLDAVEYAAELDDNEKYVAAGV